MLKRHDPLYSRSIHILFHVPSWVLQKRKWRYRAEHTLPRTRIPTRRSYVSVVGLTPLPANLPRDAANQNNGLRRVPRRVTDCYRVRRWDGDIRIHICTHEEIPERDPKDPRSPCVFAAILPILAGASDSGSGFRAAYPTS